MTYANVTRNRVSDPQTFTFQSGKPTYTPPQYSTVVGGNQFLQLLEVQPPQFPHPWLVAHRANAKGAVHVPTVIEGADGRQYFRFLITRRPAMGGQLTLESPAGLVGDKDPKETPLQAAGREVDEEVGQSQKKVKMLSNFWFPASPGAVTEKKAFALAMVDGQPEPPHYDGADEKAIMVGQIDVPVTTIKDYRRFMAWINDLATNGLPETNGQPIQPDMSILAIRALLPPLVGGRLSLFA